MIIKFIDDEVCVVDCENGEVRVEKKDYLEVSEKIFGFLIMSMGKEFVEDNFESLSEKILMDLVCIKCNEKREVN